MRQGQDQRGERLTDNEALFALVLGIVKLAPMHDRYQFGGYSLKYEETDGIIEMQLLNPKQGFMFQANVSLEEQEDGSLARVFANWPSCSPSPEHIKETRVALRKMVLAVVHHDYAESRNAMDSVTYVERFI